jgi:AraC-like DNA-binding protein
MYTAGRTFLQIVRAAESIGIDSSQLCKEIGIDFSKLESHIGNIDTDLASKFIEKLAKLSPHPEVGIEIGKRINLLGLKALGYSLMSSDNLHNFFQRVIRYQQLLGGKPSIHVKDKGLNYSFHFDLTGNNLPVPHQAIDIGISALHCNIEWILQCKVIPVKINLKRPPPKSLSAFKEVFHCTPIFNQDNNSIIFDKATIEMPFPTSDKNLAELHDQLVNKDISYLQINSLSRDVREFILKNMSVDKIGIEQAIEHFSLGKRTFQRKLKEEGYTFIELVDDVKRNLAKKYIEETDISYEEVAFLLGFTERGNFARTFKRWYGCTPREYRARVNTSHLSE